MSDDKRNADQAAFGHGAVNGHCCGLTKREYFMAHAPAMPSGWAGTAPTMEQLARPDNAIFKEFEWRMFYADQMFALIETGEVKYR